MRAKPYAYRMPPSVRLADGSDPDENWRGQSLCKTDPDAWFSGRTQALCQHICLAHCPVLSDCAKWAADLKPLDRSQQVIAGIYWSKAGKPARVPGSKIDRCVLCPAPPRITRETEQQKWLRRLI